MRKAGALLLAAWRTASSYRLRLLLSLAALVVTVLPFMYATRAMQGLMAEKIRGESPEFFSFVLVGMVVFSFLSTSVNALPGAIGAGIGNGSLEALMATPTRTSELLLGLVSYDFLWTLARGAVMLTVGALLGAHFVWTHLLSAFAILLLILLAYLPIGLIAAASMLAFRTAGPLPQAVLLVSGLLGGVYFPTTVIPGWVKNVPVFVPLTYGLRSLRAVLLDGASLMSVRSDLFVLAGMAGVLIVLGAAAFSFALRHVKRTGGLSQY